MPDVYVSKQRQTTMQKEKQEEELQVYNPLSAYCYKPENVYFETQDEGEKIVLLLRKHPITNIPWIIVVILMSFAPLLLKYFPLLSFLPSNFLIAAIILWYLLTIASAIEGFLQWFFNVYIVTDERIVDFDFYNLIYKEISEAKIDKIQDVTYKVGGLVRTIFNYGDVAIQTAGTVPNFDFEAVPNPQEVVKILQALRTEEEIEALEGRVR
jgi:uncharacterized membrane protein YdbT with pleckstrin-like domain